MKKYIIALLIALTIIFTITACGSETKYYCKNCDAEVTVNEAIMVDHLPTCEECGCHRVYKK